MQYCSTRSEKGLVSSSEAIVRGLAPDGGLYVPAGFPKAELESLQGLSYPALAARLLKLFLTDYESAFLEAAAGEAYGPGFGGKAGRLVRVEDGLYALELWHGPTCAFKDYALQLMPKLLVEAKKNLGDTETTLILVATSGDTGKAALEGYRDVPGVEIRVFYPNDGTSEIQRLQMSTQEGGNVGVWAVEGNFDSAQTGVKRVFADAAVAEALAGRGVRLSSANSINFGRLVPQLVYYFHAYLSLVREGAVPMGEAVDFCVPTGNFGDILAGWYAKQMGLPVGRLVCASNRNKVLADFFDTGVYEARREFYKTTSPSMDILVSSNLERLLYHLGGSPEAVAGWMQALAAEGRYKIGTELLARIRRDFAGGFAADEEAAAEIKELFARCRYLADPHTATAFRVAQRNRTGAPMVVLSTASPFKFPGSVLEALGQAVPENEFDAMIRLEEATGAKAPAALAALQTKPERFAGVIRPAEIAAVALGER